MAINSNRSIFDTARLEIAVAFALVSAITAIVLIALFIAIHHTNLQTQLLSELWSLINRPCELTRQVGSDAAEPAIHQLVRNIIAFSPLSLALLLAVGLLFASIIISPVERTLSYQRNFIAEASHELKTPLAAAQLNAEALFGDTILDTKSQERAQFILTAIERMSVLVGDLLWLANENNVQQREFFRNCDLKSICTEVARDWTPLFTEKGVSFKTTFDEIRVHRDENSIKKMLSNLVSNALKYTPRGGSVHFSLRTEGDLALIEVNDTGMGIDEESMPYIFERFYRSPDARASAEGSGLGLSIVKSVVAAHRGKVRLKSSPAVGTTVIIRIPARH